MKSPLTTYLLQTIENYRTLMKIDFYKIIENH